MRNVKFSTLILGLIISAALLGCFAFAAAQTSKSVSKTPKGPGKVIVHPALGGVIFGFDVDQNGSEGLLERGCAGWQLPVRKRDLRPEDRQDYQGGSKRKVQGLRRR